jgi:glutathionyl-hydroquinone reductase
LFLHPDLVLFPEIAVFQMKLTEQNRFAISMKLVKTGMSCVPWFGPDSSIMSLFCSGGRYTVPILWDKHTKTIVNNESIEILKILNTSFNHLLPESSPARLLDLFPPALASTIEETNSWIYPQINNGFTSSIFTLDFMLLGVYRAGFAQSQQAYEQAVHEVFEALDRCEEILSNSRFHFPRVQFSSQITLSQIYLLQ